MAFPLANTLLVWDRLECPFATTEKVSDGVAPGNSRTQGLTYSVRHLLPLSDNLDKPDQEILDRPEECGKTRGRNRDNAGQEQECEISLDATFPRVWKL